MKSRNSLVVSVDSKWFDPNLGDITIEHTRRFDWRNFERKVGSLYEVRYEGPFNTTGHSITRISVAEYVLKRQLVELNNKP